MQADATFSSSESNQMSNQAEYQSKIEKYQKIAENIVHEGRVNIKVSYVKKDDEKLLIPAY